jgi:hypothetical protein
MTRPPSDVTIVALSLSPPGPPDPPASGVFDLGYYYYSSLAKSGDSPNKSDDEMFPSWLPLPAKLFEDDYLRSFSS